MGAEYKKLRAMLQERLLEIIEKVQCRVGRICLFTPHPSIDRSWNPCGKLARWARAHAMSSCLALSKPVCPRHLGSARCLYHAADSAEDVRRLLVDEIERLSFKLDKSKQIFKLIEERKEMIAKMIAF